MRLSFFLFLLFSSSCSTAEVAPSSVPETRYRVGDFVVYHYGGSALQSPVVLREEVVAQHGNRLRIDVTATRGEEKRRWAQVLTDTPANQKNNVVDALYVAEHGRWRRLENTENQDLYHLYEWVVASPEGRAVDVRAAPCMKQFAEARFDCTCTTGTNRMSGVDVTFEESECPGFLWTHGPARFTDKTGADIFSLDVIDAGHQTATDREPLEPNAN
jgi:hypothetical protein